MSSKHIVNSWIFRKSAPNGLLNTIDRCFGDSCRLKQHPNLEEAQVIPFFNWLDDSFLLVGVKDAQLVPLDVDYLSLSHDLLHRADVISIADIVWKKDQIVLMIEYKQFPPNLVQSFRQKRDLLKGSKPDDLAIVQFSWIRSLQDGTSGKAFDYEISSLLDLVLSYLPNKL